MVRRGGIVVRVDGLEALRQRLEEIPPEIQDGLRRVVRDSTAEVREGTRRRVRRKDGGLWRGVEVLFREGGLGARVGWFKPELYYAKFHEWGTKRFPAQPALVPAIEEERAKLRGRVVDEVRRSLRRMR